MRSREDMIKVNKATRFKKGEQRTKDCGRKGGKIYQQMRRERRDARKNLLELVAMPLREGKIDYLADHDFIDKELLENGNFTILDKMQIKLLNDAMKGDKRAYEIVMEQLGAMGSKKIEADLTVKNDSKEILNLYERLRNDDDFRRKFFGEEDDD